MTLYDVFLKGEKLMEYISAKEASEKWGISKRRVQILCAENRIKGVMKVGNVWIIPKNSQKPKDARIKMIKDSEEK